jgi:2'-5' RNA ligase
VQKIMTPPLTRKTHRTAVAIVPPEAVWPPIQAIRRVHDRHFQRWMPHINLLYPFVPPEDFPAAVPLLLAACQRLPAVPTTLQDVRYFPHAARRATIWLAPEPRAALVHLFNRLQAVCPHHNDLGRFAHGFTPHLSIAQADSRAMLQQLLPQLTHQWHPQQFDVTALALLQRDAEQPFRIAHWLPLGPPGGRDSPA